MGDDRRALVLGGGGVVGIAWLYGLVAGLAADGVDLAGADLVVGTSAGATVGATLAAGRDPQDLLAAQLDPPPGEIAANVGLGLALRLGITALAGPRDPQRVRARLGGLARTTGTVPEATRLAAIESRLGGADWPTGRDLWLTVIDAHTGAFRVLRRDDGVPLATAVAASSAVPGVWPPVSALDTRWIDGGFRSSANADLAAGYGRVVVLAPSSGGPAGSRPRAQAEALAALARVAYVEPDRRSRRAFGRNLLDPARRPGAARAGRAQAADVAAEVARVWG